LSATAASSSGVTEKHYPKTEAMLSAINLWTQPLIDHPAFRQLIRSKIGSARDWEDDWQATSGRVSEVIMPEPLASQHDVVIQFYNLWSAAERLKTTEFYFRRYPFRDLPVNPYEHLENVCAMYFSYFYVFQERLKVFFAALAKACPEADINAGGLIKLYKARFKTELAERNGGTHIAPFDDLTIGAVLLRSLTNLKDSTDARAAERYAYRKAAREWAGHARRGGERVAIFLEGVAGGALPVAKFLETPPSPGPDDLKTR
jgi:hypothetical protein